MQVTVVKVEKLSPTFTVHNSALLAVDLMDSLSRLLDGNSTATPAEFYAVSTFAEALALHERIYFVGGPDRMPSAFSSLVERGILIPLPDVKKLYDDLRLRDEDELASSLLWPAQFNVLLFEGASGIKRIRRLLELEKEVGLAHLATFEGTPDIEWAESVFKEDLSRLALEFLLTRGLYASASVLDLEYYPGLLSLPYILGEIAAERRLSLQIYDRLVAEFSDIGPGDKPLWNRKSSPIVGQMVLNACIEKKIPLVAALLEMRNNFNRFRMSLSGYAGSMAKIKTRGEQRELRLDLEAAWNSLLSRESKSQYRLVHQLWSLFKNPLKMYQVALDQLVERDKLDHALMRFKGLTDVWRLFESAPVVRSNAKLLYEATQRPIDERSWSEIVDVGKDVESITFGREPIRNE